MLAKELKVNIETVRGTGPYGRISDEDVRAAAGKPAEAPKREEKKPAPPAPAPTPAPAPGAAVLEERIPLRGIRRTIADNLMRSLQRMHR
jgi:pyruvate dehydrogenase E2 component (dihydrolipoamide acetyltransferase)